MQKLKSIGKNSRRMREEYGYLRFGGAKSNKEAK